MGSSTQAPDTNTEDTKPDEGCESDLSLYRREVWGSVMSSRCVSCHSGAGMASESSFVLVEPEWGAGYIDANFAVSKEVALDERKGVSRLLLKASGQIEHKGGAVIAPNSPEYQALERFVERVKHPSDCPEDDSKDAKILQKVALIDRAATFRKASILFAARLPTQDEITQLRSGDDATLKSMLRALTKEDAYFEQLRVWFNDFLHVRKYARGQEAVVLLQTSDYPTRTWYRDIEDNTERAIAQRASNDALTNEVLELMLHVVRQDKSFQEVLTADYTMVNAFSAKCYGVAIDETQAKDRPLEFVPATLEGIPHAGILSSHLLMNRWPTTPTNRNRHRANQVFGLFLGTDVEGLASRPLDITKVADHNPTVNNKNCALCHVTVDPVAGAFQNWDEKGSYRPLEAGWFPEMPPPGLGKEAIPADAKAKSLQWLAQEVTKDPRFAASVVRLAYKMVMGKAALSRPSKAVADRSPSAMRAFELQSDYLRALSQRFQDGGYRLPELMVELAMSPYFRAAPGFAPEGDEREIFADMGRQVRLTPEQLQRKLVAVFGYGWNNKAQSRSYLLDDNWYRVDYGGIDSSDILDRNLDANAVGVSITRRMANEMVCWHVPREFALGRDKRRLFVHVDKETVPLDDKGLAIPAAQTQIRHNLVHLYQQLLGQTLDLQDPQIERAYRLFEDIWRQGQAEIAQTQAAAQLIGDCQFSKDHWGQIEDAETITSDENFVLRSWMGVLSYIMSDYRFLYE